MVKQVNVNEKYTPRKVEHKRVEERSWEEKNEPKVKLKLTKKKKNYESG